MRSCSLSRHLHQGRRYPLSSGLFINFPENKVKAHLSWIYAHVGRPVEYKVEKKGEDSTLTAVKVGSPPGRQETH